MSRIACLPLIAATIAILCMAARSIRTQDPADQRSIPLRSAPSSVQGSAWRSFLQRHGPGWRARWNPATGTPGRIWGTGIRLDPGPVDARRAAELSWEVLHTYGDLLGTGVSTYREVIARNVNGVHILVYDQYYRDLPVIGGRADVRINRQGILAMLGSRTLPIPDRFSTTPTIGESHARARAYLDLGAEPAGAAHPDPLAGAAGRLVIWGDVNATTKTPVHLAWEISVRPTPPAMPGRAYVDAHSAAVLHFEPVVHFARDGPPPAADVGTGVGLHRPGAHQSGENTYSGNVRAWANLGLTPHDPLQLVPLANLRVTVPGAGTAHTDANGDFSIPGAGNDEVAVTVGLSGRYVADVVPDQGARVQQTLLVSPNTPARFELLHPEADEHGRSQTTAYWFATDANEYLRGVLGASQGPMALDAMIAAVNLVQSCNAFYVGNTINFFASSPGCNNSSYSTIIYHEWGHGLDAEFGGISQVDGLSEGWGDILAMYRTGQPIVGQDFYASGLDLRSGDNTRSYPPAGCGGVLHCEGQSWMGFAWKVRERLRSSLGIVAGTTRAERIVLGSIVADARNQPDAVLEVFLLDDDDGNLLNGTPNYPDLRWAAIQHDLPYPDRKAVTIAHDALADTGQQFTPHVLTAIATPLFGAVREVRVTAVRDDTLASVTRVLVPTGAQDEYRALLPGQDAPAVIRYHLEAEHQEGDVERLPASGTFVYQVGDAETFLVDDFEAGNAGWSHGAVVAQDDWQIGPPMGAWGRSGGTTWSDPGSAYSGVSIRGNDLGLPGADGSYPANTESWLRSPTFSTVGRNGITLSFARWLTVEEHLFDRATILVNDQEVWANPANVNLLDSGWSIQQIPIPEADDRDSVQIEWRLQSDASVQFGGWNIDDVRVSSLRALPPPDIVYTLQPEQTPILGLVTLAATGPPGAPIAILFSRDPGPTAVPGIPVPLAVGADAQVQPSYLDELGRLNVSFAVPDQPTWKGTLMYSQIVALDGTEVRVSNPTVLLFTH